MSLKTLTLRSLIGAMRAFVLAVDVLIEPQMTRWFRDPTARDRCPLPRDDTPVGRELRTLDLGGDLTMSVKCTHEPTTGRELEVRVPIGETDQWGNAKEMRVTRFCLHCIVDHLEQVIGALPDECETDERQHPGGAVPSTE